MMKSYLKSILLAVAAGGLTVLAMVYTAGWMLYIFRLDPFAIKEFTGSNNFTYIIFFGNEVLWFTVAAALAAVIPGTLLGFLVHGKPRLYALLMGLTAVSLAFFVKLLPLISFYPVYVFYPLNSVLILVISFLTVSFGSYIKIRLIG